VAERGELPGVDVGAVALELLTDEVRQRQVHVVATEQDVLTDRDPARLEPPILRVEQDGREIGGAAADIDDEHDVANPELRPPGVPAAVEPGVECRLRLLEQRELVQTGGERRLHRVLARGGVERRRHGQDDILIAERSTVGIAGAKRLADVLEDAERGLDR